MTNNFDVNMLLWNIEGEDLESIHLSSLKSHRMILKSDSPWHPNVPFIRNPHFQTGSLKKEFLIGSDFKLITFPEEIAYWIFNETILISPSIKKTFFVKIYDG